MNNNPSSVSTPRRNLAREVLLSLRKDIISGKLRPGAPLSEPMLSRRFSFSRAPIREALIELEREGLVQFETTGRTRVRTLAEKDFDEIVEARVALESMGARRASVRWTAKDSAWIEKNIAAEAKASTLPELSRLDIELHEYVMRCCANQRLLALWQSIRWQFEMCLALTHRSQQKLAFKPRSITVDSHLRLLAALASGKPEVAAQTMSAHIVESLEWSLASVPAEKQKLRVKSTATPNDEEAS
jgi:DNA-binding GntR family transcriptional regulator